MWLVEPVQAHGAFSACGFAPQLKALFYANFFFVAAALFVCGLGNAHEHKTQTRNMPFASVALHREAPQDVPRPAILATHKSAIHQAASSSSCLAQTSKQGPLYPTLRANPFPKLQIYVADFPYLHCTIDQRLLTLET